MRNDLIAGSSVGAILAIIKSNDPRPPSAKGPTNLNTSEAGPERAITPAPA